MNCKFLLFVMFFACSTETQPPPAATFCGRVYQQPEERAVLLCRGPILTPTALRAFVNVDTISLLWPQLHDIGFLKYANPVALKNVNILNTQVQDIDVLARFPNLESLEISLSPVRSLRGLEKAMQLSHLDLHGVPVSDLSPLGAHRQLRYLFVEQAIGMKGQEMYIPKDQRIRDLSPLAEIASLEELTLRGTLITSVAPLAKLKRLKSLSLLSSRELTDISALKALTSLKHLYVDLDTGLLPQVKELKQSIPGLLVN